MTKSRTLIEAEGGFEIWSQDEARVGQKGGERGSVAARPYPAVDARCRQPTRCTGGMPGTEHRVAVVMTRARRTRTVRLSAG